MKNCQRLVAPVVALLAATLLIIQIVFNPAVIRGDSLGQNRVLKEESLKIDFKDAKSKTEDLLNLIRHRYELDGIGALFFLVSNNMGAHTWDIMKYKFAAKMINKDQTFLMTFGGSSVTASHDNYYNQSYPAVVERRLGPILKALDVKLMVHNIAQGANACVPYSYCYESMGGLDPDFIGWEQSYNCGHDDQVFEMMARLTGFSSNRAVLYYSASGAWTPKDCPESPENSTPYSSENWDPSVIGLPKWNPSQQDIDKEKGLLDSYHAAGDSVHRFSAWTKYDPAYAKIGYHGFNVWEPNPKCDILKPSKTSCSGMDAAQGCKMKFMTKEAAYYGATESTKGANWHPTRGFHMLRGEAISWLYALILLDSINMVEKDQKSDSTENLKKMYDAKLSELQPPLPMPKKCENHNLHCAARPTCYTNFMPHYPSNMTLSELVVGYTNWTIDPSGIADHVDLKKKGTGEWSLKYGYLDEKPLMMATHHQGEIHFKITIGVNNFLWLCGGAHKESLKHILIYLDKDVNITLDNKEKIDADGINTGKSSYKYTPSANRVLWLNKKYVGNECKAVTDLPVGNHILSISTNSSQESHMVKLSHIILWP